MYWYECESLWVWVWGMSVVLVWVNNTWFLCKGSHCCTFINLVLIIDWNKMNYVTLLKNNYTSRFPLIFFFQFLLLLLKNLYLMFTLIFAMHMYIIVKILLQQCIFPLKSQKNYIRNYREINKFYIMLFVNVQNLSRKIENKTFFIYKYL